MIMQTVLQLVFIYTADNTERWNLTDKIKLVAVVGGSLKILEKCELFASVME